MGVEAPSWSTASRRRCAAITSFWFQAGAPAEVAVVQRIYRMFVSGRLSRAAIARTLNRDGVPSESGTRWTFNTVHRVLVSSKYLGELVSNQSTAPLGSKRAPAPDAYAVRLAGAFEPIISGKLFDAAARRIVAERPVVMTREQMTEAAKALFERHGRILYKLIAATPGIPNSTTFVVHFGGIGGIYQAIGQPPPGAPRRRPIHLDDDEMLRRLADLRRRAGYLTRGIIREDPTLPSVSTVACRFGSLAQAYARIGFISFQPGCTTPRSGARGSWLRSSAHKASPAT